MEIIPLIFKCLPNYSYWFVSNTFLIQEILCIILPYQLNAKCFRSVYTFSSVDCLLDMGFPRSEEDSGIEGGIFNRLKFFIY